MKHLLILGGLVASMALVSCEDDDMDENLSPQDTNFANQITLSNRSEIALSNMALMKATDQSVRNYAQMMITEHTAAENDLKQIADDLDLSLPTDSLTPMAQMMRTQLMALSGRRFDSAYIAGQIPAHDSSRVIVQTQISSGANGPLRNFASALLPRIEMHRMMADTIAARVR